MDKEGKNLYYIYEYQTDLGLMVNIIDKIVIDKQLIKGLKYNKVCDESSIITIIKEAVSLSFYGEGAVEMGVSLGFVHPAAVKKLNGVKVAMFYRIY